MQVQRKVQSADSTARSFPVRADLTATCFGDAFLGVFRV